jgi:hypothetical protein
MAIKAGQILHVANQFVIDRIQTAGPGNLNIPQERVFELGNYQTVGIVRDLPELTFALDCLDVGTEVEAILTGSATPTSDAAHTLYDLSVTTPIDIISPWKSPYAGFSTVRGVAIPSLSLESASYKYGLKENAGENFSLKGDSIFYVPGTPWQDKATGDGIEDTFAYENGPALAYVEAGETLYALNVSINGQRLHRGDDFTDTDTDVVFATPPENGAKISIVYGAEAASSYTQSGSTPFGSGANNPVHQGLSVKPAAIKGKDIDVYFTTIIGGNPIEVRWPDVQSASVDWKVSLDDDKEFGNYQAVARDFTDIPDVTGSIEIKPRSVEAFFARLYQITGVADGEVIGPQSSVTGALRIELRNPSVGGATGGSVGDVMKTLRVPDARFTIPGYEGKVQSKLTSTIQFQSDTGVFQVYKGSIS